MIAIGKIIPDGTYQAYHEEKIRPVALNEFRGQWLSILCFTQEISPLSVRRNWLRPADSIRNSKNWERKCAG